MRKLTLKLEDLEVDSFDSTSTLDAKGTVIGQDSDTEYQSCEETCGYNCVSLYSCDYRTCAGFATKFEQDRYCIYC